MWEEIESKNVRVFMHEDEDRLLYLIRTWPRKYMVVHEDAYDIATGNVEFLDEEDVKVKYGIVA